MAWQTPQRLVERLASRLVWPTVMTLASPIGRAAVNHNQSQNKNASRVLTDGWGSVGEDDGAMVGGVLGFEVVGCDAQCRGGT